MLKVIELFSGIGSQRQALKEANIDHEVIAISDIDKYANKVYEALHGLTKNLGDIRTIERLPKADLWTYSFPCTDISLGGNMKGFDKGSNTSSSLLWEVERLLKVAQEEGTLPRYLLMENVKNILSKKFRVNFDEWCSFLVGLGYKNFYQVLNAKDYGVPQNRERCFMLSILNFDGVYVFPKKQELAVKLSDLLEKEVDEKYYLSDKIINCFTNMENRNGLIRGLTFKPKEKDAACAFTITTHAGNRPCDNFIIEPIPSAMRGRYDENGKINQQLEIKDDGNTNALTMVTKDNLIIVPEATKKEYSVAHVGDGIYTNRPHQKRGVVQRNKIPTLKTSPNDIAVEVSDPSDLISIRRLTPRECFRLMGWKDCDIDRAFSVGVSDTQLYKMAGNAIVVNCLTEIFKSMKECDDNWE